MIARLDRLLVLVIMARLHLARNCLRSVEFFVYLRNFSVDANRHLSADFQLKKITFLLNFYADAMASST